MPIIKILSGTTPAKDGFFISTFGKDQISVSTGLFRSKQLLLPDVVIRTDDLKASDKSTTRFYLNDSTDEWLCECSTKAFSSLQAMVLKQKYKTNSTKTEASAIGEKHAQSTHAYQAGAPIGNANAKKASSLSSKFVGAIGGVILVAMLVQCSKSNEDKPVDKVEATVTGEKKSSLLYQLTGGGKADSNKLAGTANETNLKNLRSRITDDVFTPYTRSGYSKTFAKYGNRMSDVEKARQAAAFLAASSGKCSRVEGSEVATDSSRENIQTFTDCKDEKTGQFERFRFQESELKDKNGRFFTESTVATSQKAQTIQEKAMSKDAAKDACRAMVIKSAKFPSSVDFATFSTVANTSVASGETWVEINFEAKNELGAMLPYKASCGFPINGKATLSVSKR